MENFSQGEPMKHGKWGLRTLFLIGMGVFFAAALYGQSVVDMARQTRSRKSGASQTGRVFTNENVARPAPAAAAGAARPAGQAPGAAPAAPPGQPPAQPAAGAPASPPQQKSEAELEKEYRDKFAQLREALALEERKLDVMQRELNLMQNQFYTNPQDTLTQETTRGNINTRMQEIEAQKANAEKARQAVAALEEELHVKGLPSGWAR